MDWVRAAIKKYLAEGGFDGLYCTELACGCALDDLAPCGEFANFEDCQPGYKIPGCSPSCGEGCDLHIGPKEKLRCQHCGYEGPVSEFRRKLPDDEWTHRVGDEYGEECPECGKCPR